MNVRLDQLLVQNKLASTRSQAESYIKLGKVKVNGELITKPGQFINPTSNLEIDIKEQYVSRAALKLASVSEQLKLDFNNKIVLDVGSSTGGFTDYALRNGAQKVVAVDVGSEQLHPSLRDDPRIELHEKTDIRNIKVLSSTPDIVVIDVSFISLREVLPHIAEIVGKNTQVVAMVKPQFEAGTNDVNKGVIKNDTLRRKILKEFEIWSKALFNIEAKADSQVAGAKGNLERFYLLKRI